MLSKRAVEELHELPNQPFGQSRHFSVKARLQVELALWRIEKVVPPAHKIQACPRHQLQAACYAIGRVLGVQKRIYQPGVVFGVPRSIEVTKNDVMFRQYLQRL